METVVRGGSEVRPCSGDDPPPSSSDMLDRFPDGGCTTLLLGLAILEELSPLVVAVVVVAAAVVVIEVVEVVGDFGIVRTMGLGRLNFLPDVDSSSDSGDFERLPCSVGLTPRCLPCEEGCLIPAA